jgi:hypothetical protein
MSASGTPWIGPVLAVCLLGAVSVRAQVPPSAGSETAPATTTAVAPLSSPPPALHTIWPSLDWATLGWFGAVCILILAFRPRPITWCRNLDGLVLAAMCLLLVARDTSGSPCASPHDWRWWATLGLSVAVAYWIMRAVGLLGTWRPVKYAGAITGGARCVLVLVGLVLCGHQIATAPVSPASRDALAGGIYMADTGKLPYGDAAPYDTRSPLLYMAHAGAVKVAPPASAAIGRGTSGMTWAQRSEWLRGDWIAGADVRAVRLVNGVLFLLTLLGLVVIGRRLLTEGSAAVMVAMFCIFPGTLECLPRPEIMLPVTLLTWTVAFALVPGVGGLLSTLTLVFAGLAWPWLWLSIPVVLGWSWRRGVDALGGFVGLLGGIALSIWGMLALVQPALPLANGAIATAALQPLYEARVADQYSIQVRTAQQPTTRPSPAVSAPFWRQLIEKGQVSVHSIPVPPRRKAVTAPARAPATQPIDITWQPGVGGENIYFWQIDPTPEAQPMLQAKYRAALDAQPSGKVLLNAARTVLERTWLLPDPGPAQVRSAWEIWLGQDPRGAQLWIRRGVKLLGGIVALIGLVLVRRGRPRHLIGGLLAVNALALFASHTGPLDNLVWLMPLLVAAWALHEPDEERAERDLVRRRVAPPTAPPAAIVRPIERGPAPRITLDAKTPVAVPEAAAPDTRRN